MARGLFKAALPQDKTSVGPQIGQDRDQSEAAVQRVAPGGCASTSTTASKGTKPPLSPSYPCQLQVHSLPTPYSPSHGQATQRAAACCLSHCRTDSPFWSSYGCVCSCSLPDSDFGHMTDRTCRRQPTKARKWGMVPYDHNMSSMA